MLRLPATKLELGSRDMAWHKHRFELRKFEFEYYMRTGQVCSPDLPLRSRRTQNPFRVLGDDDAPFSRQPVPQDSDTFWKAVLENATSALIGLPIPRRRLRREPVPTSTSSNRSHLAQNIGDWRARTRADGGDASQASNGSGRRSQRLSGLSSDSMYSLHKENFGEEMMLQLDSLSSEQSNGDNLTNPHDSYLPRLRKSEGDLLEVQEQLASQLNLDGIQDDRRLRNERLYHQESPPRFAVAHDGSTPGSAEHRIKRLRRTASTDGQATETLEPLSELSDSPTSIIHRHRSSEPASTSPVLPSLDRVRKCSGNLPRSPLYISQAALSSSPEKRCHNEGRSGMFDGNGSHRTAQNLQCEGTGTGSLSEEDGFTSERESLDGDYSGWGPDEAADNALFSHEASPERQRLEDFSPLSAMNLHASIASASTQSPPYVADRSDIRSSPPMRPPCTSSRTPVHFTTLASNSGDTMSLRLPYLLPSRTGSRNVSLEMMMPISTPTYENENPLPIDPGSSPQPTTSSPSLPLRTNAQVIRVESDTVFSPPSPPPVVPGAQRTPARSMRVYDDFLLTASQPQTPIGLPRHGIPSMSMDGTFAAPPPSTSRHATRRSQQHGRNPENGMLEGHDGWVGWPQHADPDSTYEQENVRGEARWERQQRTAERRARTAGRTEGILERTPPRGETAHARH